MIFRFCFKLILITSNDICSFLQIGLNILGMDLIMITCNEKCRAYDVKKILLCLWAFYNAWFYSPSNEKYGCVIFSNYFI